MAASISFCTLDDVCEQTGTVVVIDVLRAFTTAAVALAAGASPYRLVGTTAEAFAIKAANADARLLGEVDTLKPELFDHSNSPWEIDGQDLSGTAIVHRSSSGTQGVVQASGAARILTASFAVAAATARALRPEVRTGTPIAFCVTGVRHDVDGDEDRACGEYIAALLTAEDGAPTVDVTPYLTRVGDSTAAGKFRIGNADHLPPEDLPFAQVVDRFDFAMEVRHGDDGSHTLHRLPV